MHVAQQGAFLAVFETESFDGAGETGRDDVVRAHAEAAETLPAEETGIGIHSVPEHGGGGLIVIANPAGKAAGLFLIDLTILQAGDEAAFIFPVNIRLMAALGLQNLETQRPVFFWMIPDGQGEDALVVIAASGTSGRQSQPLELRRTVRQVFTLAKIQISRMEIEPAGPFFPEQGEAVLLGRGCSCRAAGKDRQAAVRPVFIPVRKRRPSTRLSMMLPSMR